MIGQTERPGSADAAEVERLRTSLSELRRRMILFARLLPADLLWLLDASLGELEAEVSGSSFLEGLSNSTDLVASDVEPALRETWAQAFGA